MIVTLVKKELFGEASQAMASCGVTLIDAYVTLGHYDNVMIIEAPDAEAAAASALIASQGNVRAETLLTTFGAEFLQRPGGQLMPRSHPSEPQYDVPRFAPDQPLPPYSYVPGRFPHPVSDPQGHSFGAHPPPAELLHPDRWQNCRAYLYGVDLFNHGYYWEAHEAWEGLWIACGRTGPTGWFLKGLIKLAAAGVKARAENVRGMQRHARRAAELFQQTAHELTAEDRRFMGLRLTELIRFAGEIANRTTTVNPGHQHSVEVVFNFILQLR